MSFVATAIGGSAILGAGASIYGANKAAKAAKNVKPVDIGKLAADARANAEANLRQSLQLESQLLPGQAAARTATGDAFAGLFTGTSQAAREEALSGMLDLARRGGVSPLQQQAADQILADLELGGSLDPETQAAVVRGALQRTGASGITGSQAGRGLTARDLGLTSLGLRQSRIQKALTAGQSLTAADIAARTGLQNILGAQAGQVLTAQQLLSGMLPEAGLSPGDLASVAIGNANMANQANMQAAQAKAAGAQGVASALASGLGMFAKRPTPPAAPAATPTYDRSWI